MSARDAITDMVRAVNGSSAYAVAGLPLLLDQYRAEVLREAADAVAGAFHGEPFLNYPPDFADLLRRMAGAAESDKGNHEGESGPALTVYRASHDSLVMGLYTTATEARAHCMAEERREWASDANPVFDWIEDEEDDVAELVTVAEDGETETVTGYVVTALEVASKYDPEAEG